MKKIKVDLRKRSYDITIGKGAFSLLPGVVVSLKLQGPAVFIVDSGVHAKASGLLTSVIKKMPCQTHVLTIPGSERSKSLSMYQKVITDVAKMTSMHKPFIVAIGGGVTGDLSGFVAATYRRGIPVIHIPTTLLAQVDSSIGGKTGIDLVSAKNIIGAFKQPAAILMDTAFMGTLPARQICNGLAEVIKYSVIKSRMLFSYLENNIENIIALDDNALEQVVYTCALIKAKVVERDELDNKDIRIMLNFGHTMGHAIEAASGLGRGYSHGEAVAVGMLIAGEIAVKLGMFKADEFVRMSRLVRNAGLPTLATRADLKKVMNSFAHDKKFLAGVNRFVLPSQIGLVEVVENIPEQMIRSVTKKYVG